MIENKINKSWWHWVTSHVTGSHFNTVSTHQKICQMTHIGSYQTLMTDPLVPIKPWLLHFTFIKPIVFVLISPTDDHISSHDPVSFVLPLFHFHHVSATHSFLSHFPHLFLALLFSFCHSNTRSVSSTCPKPSPLYSGSILPVLSLDFVNSYFLKHMMRGERQGQIDGITNYIYRKKIHTLTISSYTDFENKINKSWWHWVTVMWQGHTSIRVTLQQGLCFVSGTGSSLASVSGIGTGIWLEFRFHLGW